MQGCLVSVICSSYLICPLKKHMMRSKMYNKLQEGLPQTNLHNQQLQSPKVFQEKALER